jgi:nitrile hydratase
MGILSRGAIIMSEHHDHHSAPANPYLEKRRNGEQIAKLEARTKQLEDLLVSKGLLTSEALDRMIEIFEHDLGPMNGARVIARAWTDADYRKRLLDNATDAIAELGYSGLQGEHMIAVENTSAIHNVVVCTLCSCYPWPVLGLPPAWYKDAPYRSRVVIEPRSVLAEFGTELSPDVEIRVWDSSAEVRYLVVPERPPGTEALSEGELAELITRDAMIGVTRLAAH